MSQHNEGEGEVPIETMEDFRKKRGKIKRPNGIKPYRRASMFLYTKFFQSLMGCGRGEKRRKLETFESAARHGTCETGEPMQEEPESGERDGGIRPSQEELLQTGLRNERYCLED